MSKRTCGRDIQPSTSSVFGMIPWDLGRAEIDTACSCAVMLDDSKGIESFSESATIDGRDLVRDIQYNNRTTFPSRGQPKEQASREQKLSGRRAAEHGQRTSALLHSCSTVLEGNDKPSPVLDQTGNVSRRITGTRMDRVRASTRKKVPTPAVRPFALHRTVPRHVLGIVGMLA